MLVIKELSKKIGNKQILNNINLKIPKREIPTTKYCRTLIRILIQSAPAPRTTCQTVCFVL